MERINIIMSEKNENKVSLYNLAFSVEHNRVFRAICNDSKSVTGERGTCNLHKAFHVDRKKRVNSVRGFFRMQSCGPALDLSMM